MNTTCERPNGVKAHGDESLRNSRRRRLVRACAIHDHLAAVTASSGVFLEHFEGDRSGYHPVPGAALARPRVDHHERAARLPQARELPDRYAAHSKLVEELMASPPLQREESREDTQDEDGPQPAESRELREYAVDGVVKDDAECDACARPERRTEEHTSELQSRVDLVCRLLLEKKKTPTYQRRAPLRLPLLHRNGCGR